MARALSFTVSGTPITVYPVLTDAVSYLQKERMGVRYEKRLTAKDMKKLACGEISLEEYQNIKAENDKAKLDMITKDKEQETIKEEDAITDVDEALSLNQHNFRARGRQSKKIRKKEVYHCRACNSYRLRVVNYNRADGQNMLECANRKCLASIELTDKPAGTFIEAPLDSGMNCGWMMDSTWNYRYPKISKIESGELTCNPELPDMDVYKGDVVQLIHCPGQTSMVQIL